MTIKQAAAQFGIPANTLRGWCQQAKLNKRTGRQGCYSLEVKQAVIAASLNGEKTIALAATHHVPESTLKYWRRKAGLVREQGPQKLDHAAVFARIQAGEDINMLAREYSVTRQAILYVFKKFSRKV